MKLNKMISTFCAACMLLTALSATYALDNADPISEYAGQSVVCQVFTEADGELTSRLVTVSIPAGATQSEEATLLITTAYGPQTRSTRAVDIISTQRDITITTSSTNVGSGTAVHNYARIHASFNIDTLGGNTTISVHCRNNTTGDQSAWKTLDISTVAQTVIFTTADVPVSNGNDISVNARTNMGTAHTTVCTVQGSTF